MATHIFPDIHGRIEKLEAALSNLGFSMKQGAWRHPQGDQVVFLGDFIDRGADGGRVIDTVRRMMDAGIAQAVMGNHELNAIHYHMLDPRTGDGLRPRSEANTRQHAAFLAEFPLGEARTREVLSWMKSLPLALDTGEFRAVHACWDGPAIERLRAVAADLVLSEEQFVEAGMRDTALMKDVERVTKGPEAPLPEGYAVHDQEGVRRERVRAKWWQGGSGSWADLSMSVFDPSELPHGNAPQAVIPAQYPLEDRPVFFGHYWLEGQIELQSKNALCLDYSAGLNGPLVSYRHEAGDEGVFLDRIVVHALT